VFAVLNEVAHVATFPLSATLSHPMLAPFDWNATVPVGVPSECPRNCRRTLPGPFTVIVAVKFTVCPVTAGLLSAVSAVVVLAAFTCSLKSPVLVP
jgi:hypothetical protein